LPGRTGFFDPRTEFFKNFCRFGGDSLDFNVQRLDVAQARAPRNAQTANSIFQSDVIVRRRVLQRPDVARIGARHQRQHQRCIAHRARHQSGIGDQRERQQRVS
jgi:hypothetical protein